VKSSREKVPSMRLDGFVRITGWLGKELAVRLG